jgi:phenylacetic acid degradation operon negative regulatory protein
VPDPLPANPHLAAPARQVTRPSSFIYTLMGDLVRYEGGEIWIGSLARFMAEFGISEPAVRQAISRMTRQGWMSGRKVGNRSYYAMTARGIERVDKVSPRIYRPPEDSWDGHWRLVAYSVPERIRENRDRFRKDLTVVGFAPLGPSLWLSPRDVLDAARDAAVQSGILDHVDFFEAQSRGPRGDQDLLATCWNLESIATSYRAFIHTYEHYPVLLDDDARAFVAREWLVHDYRKFIYVDPGLPLSLLPDAWPAARASALFRSQYDRLTPGALRFFRSIFRTPPDRSA